MDEKEHICELFCGAGGMGLGFSSFFKIDDAYDVLSAAVRTYSLNHLSTNVRQMDIRELTGVRGDWDGIIGGPPCQAWSRRNIRQDPDDSRIFLLEEYVRVVEEVLPRFFVLENVVNVPQILKNDVIQRMTASGYVIWSSYLNAADYGAAQNRRRWIVIGTRNCSFQTLQRTQFRTVRQAFSGIQNNWGLMHSSSEVLEMLAKAVPDRWLPMTESGQYGSIIKLQWDLPAPTVANVKKVYMVHPEEVRNISLAEAAALQGFPPDYKWYGNSSQIAQMIANAIPVEMAATIAKSVV